MRFSGGTWQETAGNCRRVSGLKNQEHWPTFTRTQASEISTQASEMLMQARADRLMGSIALCENFARRTRLWDDSHLFPPLPIPLDKTCLHMLLSRPNSLQKDKQVTVSPHKGGLWNLLGSMLPSPRSLVVECLWCGRGPTGMFAGIARNISPCIGHQQSKVEIKSLKCQYSWMPSL